MLVLQRPLAFIDLEATGVLRLRLDDGPAVVFEGLRIGEGKPLDFKSAGVGTARSENGRPRRNVADAGDEFPMAAVEGANGIIV